MRISLAIEPTPVAAFAVAPAESPADLNEIAPALWRMLERTLREGRMSRGAIETELFEAAFEAGAHPSPLGR